MAYFSLHSYDADVRIPGFRGLNQSDIGMNPDITHAIEEENLETPNGVLQPGAAIEVLPGGFENRIETIANFFRRRYEGPGSQEWLVAATDGKLYYKQAGSTEEWTEIGMPTGITAFQNNVWSCVTYEITESDVTVDVLLISNADDGMFMVVPPDRPAIWADQHDHEWDWMSDYTWEHVKSESWVIRTVNTRDMKFGTIARSAERIWGGNIAGEPDMLMYSRPYDPTNWLAAGEDPDDPEGMPEEDGAGDILQPSWDGTNFTALCQFGDQLIAFKQNRVWRILGTNPGEYTFKEQYGGGAPYGGTIVVDTERIFMVENDGLSAYDGMSVTPVQRDLTKALWRTVNRAAMHQMVAVVFQQRYYLSFPVGDSTVNNALLIYDFHDGTVLHYSDIYIESFLKTDDRLYATSSSIPGKILEIKYDSWVTGKARGNATKWVSPWMDFGYKTIKKGGFELSLYPEVQNEAVELKLTIQTEARMRTKRVLVQPLTSEQRMLEREHKVKHVHFCTVGRKFRLIIETAEGVTAPWRLLGGIQMKVDIEQD